MDTEALVEVVRRSSALTALADESMSPRDLQDCLDVSRSTVHRLASSLEEDHLIERSNGDLALTALGEVVAREVAAFERNVKTAHRLEPVLSAVYAHDVEFDLEHFADATVTRVEPGDPYKPVTRFMELVEDTETLRGVDPAAINPLHLDDLHQAIVDGMETDAIYRPDVAWSLIENNPERAREAFESENLTLRALEDPPFGLTLCDDRVGVGVYDDSTGLLQVYVDTDDARAMEWGEKLFEEFRSEASLVDWTDALGDD